MFNRLSLWLLSVCCLAPVTTEAFAQKGGGGTTPTLPNVRYTVEKISGLSPFVWVNKINNAGMIVGHFSQRAFIYNQADGSLYKLNEEQSLRSKLNAEFGQGWIFNSAVGINDLGQVVGRVENLVTLRTEGFAMDTFSNPDSSTWVVKRLPSVPSNNSFANSINSSGEVLGVYVLVGSTDWDCFVCSPFGTDPTAIRFFGLKVSTSVALNNNGTVAGVLRSGLTFYSHRSGVIQTVNGITDCLRFGGINDGGIMSVEGRVRINRKPDLTGIFRASVSGSFEKIHDKVRQLSGPNKDSDIILQTFTTMQTVGQSKLAYNGSILIPKQVLSITDLIPDPEMKSMLVNNEFLVSAIGDRSLPTDFGQLAGRVRTANGFIGVVLTPYVPVP